VHQPSNEPGPRYYPEDGYVEPKALIDPWKAPYNYDRPGRVHPRTYDLYTYGGDGQPGGDGENADIGNWESSAAAQP
jgi:general secretion pathway protein G